MIFLIVVVSVQLQQAAKHAEELRRKRLQAKLQADLANGITITRPPRTVEEIVLTALSIVSKPEDYKRVAEMHCHGKDTGE